MAQGAPAPVPAVVRPKADNYTLAPATEVNVDSAPHSGAKSTLGGAPAPSVGLTA